MPFLPELEAASQAGTTISSQRAVPGLPAVRSAAPPPLIFALICSPRAPSPLISTSHTANFSFLSLFFLHELVFHVSNCSFMFQLRTKDRTNTSSREGGVLFS